MATRTDPLQTLSEVLDAVILARGKEGEIPYRDIDAALRSAVRAVTPGRQQKKNLEPLMDAARAAFIRTLRRRAK
jgi:hypothetical protein